MRHATCTYIGVTSDIYSTRAYRIEVRPVLNMLAHFVNHVAGYRLYNISIQCLYTNTSFSLHFPGSFMLLATHEMQDDGRDDGESSYHSNNDTRRILDTQCLEHWREPGRMLAMVKVDVGG